MKAPAQPKTNLYFSPVATCSMAPWFGVRAYAFLGNVRSPTIANEAEDYALL